MEQRGIYWGRCYLTMQVNVEVDYRKNQVIPTGQPRFYLREVERITPQGETYLESYGRDVRFGLDEWKQVAKSSGDFSKIGITLKSDGVPHFWDVVAMVRRERIQVSVLTEEERRAARELKRDQEE